MAADTPMQSPKECVQEANRLIAEDKKSEALVLMELYISDHSEVPPWFLVRLASLKLTLNQRSEARSIYEDLNRKFPRRPFGLSGLAKLSQLEGRPREAIRLWQKCFARYPDQPHARWMIEKAHSHKSVGEVRQSESLLEAAKCSEETRQTAEIALAQLAEFEQDWSLALQRWNAIAQSDPDSLTPALGRARVLNHLGEFAECETHLLRTADKHPSSPLPGCLLAAMFDSGRMRQHERAQEVWGSLALRFPGQSRILAGLARSYLQSDKQAQATAVLRELTKIHGQSIESTMLSVELHCHTFNYDKALLLLNSALEVHPLSTELCLKKAAVLRSKAMATASKDLLGDAISEVERALELQQENLSITLTLAELQVMAGRSETALELISTLPEELSLHRRVLELRIWAAMQSGQTAKAKRLEKVLRQSQFQEQLDLPPGNLQLRHGDPEKIKPNHIVLLASIYNEAWRLPRFLDHYRQLGVDYFLIVDNNSDDGSAELLCHQEDVICYFTSDHFARSAHGMRWINQLIDLHASQNWCLFADADEYLIYPHCEKLNLRELSVTLETEGAEALSAFMLDMHARTLKEQVEFDPEKSLFDSFPYFDEKHTRFGSVHCPYTTTVGGARRILSAGTCLKTKVPMINARSGIRYTDNHRTTTAVISELTSAFCHFKLVGDFQKTAMVEVTDQRRGAHCLRKHRSYAESLAEKSADFSYMQAETHRYASSHTLLSLGLIQSSENFERISSHTNQVA